ncbi:MAG: HAMP domain-containing histidine kinase [Acidaminococcaceae bacterium]|nr:HAMP domain-containing histidine kinase [Acidaminococcaceae bacterium]
MQVFGAPLLVAYRNEPSRVLLVFHDITLLQKVYERQTAFVSNASHELATPLTTIKGFAETLAEDENMDRETQNKFLQIIVKESNRMQLLLKDLLQLAKLDSAEYRKNVVIENLTTEGLLEELQMEFAQPAATRNLHLTIQYGDKPLLKTNKEWLKQILINLLENALKYTPMGGEIKISLEKGKDMAVFSVFNSGEGLNEEDKEKIFARFYRADASHNHKIKGSGLGLSIVKFAVEMLGGTIHTESSPGQGVNFIFTMPLA